MTVNDLRTKGFGIQVRHYREYIGDEGTLYTRGEAARLGFMGDEAYQNSGITVVHLYNQHGTKVGSGTAQVGVKDQFCRKTGVAIALDRALIDAIGV